MGLGGALNPFYQWENRGPDRGRDFLGITGLQDLLPSRQASFHCCWRPGATSPEGVRDPGPPVSRRKG